MASCQYTELFFVYRGYVLIRSLTGHLKARSKQNKNKKRKKKTQKKREKKVEKKNYTIKQFLFCENNREQPIYINGCK